MILSRGKLEATRETESRFSLAAYEYDDLGRRTKLTRGYGRAVTTYGYDANGRDSPYLTRLFNDLRNTANDATTTFAYNDTGQIKSATRDNDLYAWTRHYNVDRTYDVNGLNQLTRAGATVLSYDERGKLKSSGTTAKQDKATGAILRRYDAGADEPRERHGRSGTPPKPIRHSDRCRPCLFRTN